MPQAAVVLVFFVATLVRSTLGFGEALIAVPLLALWMPVDVAAPAAVLVSITIALVILIRDWKHVHFRSATRLTLYTCIGIPAGLWFLRTVPEAWGKVILAIVIAGFSLHSIRRRRHAALHDDKLAWFFGIQAGVLGGAYGMNGPPLAIYGALRGWTPSEFRATLQAYFLPASIVGMIGYAVAGLWTAPVTRAYVISLPGVLLAIALGRILHHRLDASRFPRYVYFTLIAISAMLLAQAVST